MQFGSASSLVGVLETPAGPAPPADLPAVILLNSGVVHRVGVNRLYVSLARALARRGHVVLRFDFSGVGDSGYRRDGVGFVRAAIAESREAMDELEAAAGARRFALAGICSGAVIAFRAALEDPRVCAAAMVNPIGHLHGRECDVPADYRQRVLAAHYLRLALHSSFRRQIWRRAATGRVALAPILGAAAARLRGSLAAVAHRRYDPEAAAQAEAEIVTLLARGVRLLELHAEADQGLDYVRLRLGDRLAALDDHPGWAFEVLESANHTFTRLWAQRRLVASLDGWMAAR